MCVRSKGAAGPSGEQQLRSLLRQIAPTFDPTQTAALREQIRTKMRSSFLIQGLDKNWLAGPPQVVWGDVIDGPGYRIRKLRYAAIPRYWVPALLYEPVESALRLRVGVLNADGHHDAGNAAPYKQIRCINLARKGALALSFEFSGMGELAADAESVQPCGEVSLHHNLAALELVGIGAASIMFASMSRALDVLLTHPDVDPVRIAMTGLSGGGWQTILLSALDERVQISVPVAGYTSIRARVEHCADVGDLEQVPADFATILDYPDLTAMRAPRPTLLILNEHDDCCFRTDRTRQDIYDQVRPVFEAADAAQQFQLYSNTEPGDHNYGADNRGRMYRFLGEQFEEPWTASEDHTDAEVLPEAALQVGLPVDQQTVRDIAAERARTLAVQRRERLRQVSPGERRAQLGSVLRLTRLPVPSLPMLSGVAWTSTLTVGPWRLPCTWQPGTGQPTLLIADDTPPRPPRDAALLSVGILGLHGLECSLDRILLLQTCGQRLLGIQVAQLAAVLEGLQAVSDTPAAVRAHGMTATVVATIAGALHPHLIGDMYLSGARLVRLDDLIHRGVSPTLCPSLFTPGLLEVTNGLDLRPLLEDVQLRESGRGACLTW